MFRYAKFTVGLHVVSEKLRVCKLILCEYLVSWIHFQALGF